MKTVVVISDTHGNVRQIEELLPIMEESDYVLHLGDGARDMERFGLKLKGKLLAVDGNCDPGSLGKTEGVLEAEGVRIFYTHGHLFGVKRGTEELRAYAKENGCGAALYGHTHRAEAEEEGGVLCFNPGNLSKYTAKRSYGYLVLHDGKITWKIVEIF